MSKQANLSPQIHRNKSRAATKPPKKLTPSALTPGIPHSTQPAAPLVEARRHTGRTLGRTRLCLVSPQEHLPYLLWSYTQPCSSAYAWRTVSSNIKLWDQLPTILSELKRLYRGYKLPDGHNLTSSLNSEGGMLSPQKAALKSLPGSAQSVLQSSIQERVSLLGTIFFSPADSHLPLKQAILAQPKRKHKKEVVVTSKERGKLWKVLLRSNTNAFQMLLSAARADLMCAADPKPAALLMSLLYNMLQALRGKPRLRKVLRLCVKLGLYKICTSILASHTITQVFFAKDNSADEVQLYYRCRVIEATALILTLFGRFDSKAHAVVRAADIFQRLLCALDVMALFLDVRLRGFIDALGSVTASGKDADRDEVYEGLLQVFENAVRSTAFLVSACTHLCMSIFAAVRSVSSANKLGARCAGVCAKLVTILSRSFCINIPNHFCQLFVAQSRDPSLLSKVHDVPEEGNAACGAVPSWVFSWLRTLEVAMLWAAALLQRVCERCVVRAACSAEAHKHSTLLAMHMVVCDTALGIEKVGGGSGETFEKNRGTSTFFWRQWEHRMRVVRVTLTAMDTLLKADRKLGLEELRAVGGVASVVKMVLRLPFIKVDHWHLCYTLCCSFYGLSLLPSSAKGESAYAVNLRVPEWLVSHLSSCSLGKTASPPSRATSLFDDAEVRRSFASDGKSPPTSSSQPFGRGTATGEDGASSQRDPGISPLMPQAGASVFTETMNHLLVNKHPEWFSTELNNGCIPAETELPHEDTVELPWLFTDPPPPPTNHDPHCSIDDCVSPLEAPSDSQRIEILVHHIRRLLLLDELSDDTSEDPGSHHHYHVVYDRTRAAMPRGEGVVEKIERDAIKDNNVRSDAQSSSGMLSAVSSIVFRSNFASGNLQRAIRVTEDEYDLVLDWDTATNSFTQWFCFSISGYEPGRTYRFNILNMEKKDSMFNQGQRVLMLHGAAYSESSPPPLDGTSGASRPGGWRRAGECIYYFANPYRRPPRDKPLQAAWCRGAPVHRASQLEEAKLRKPAQRPHCGTPGMPLCRNGLATASDEKCSSAPSQAASPKKVVSSPSSKGNLNAASKTYFTLSFKIVMPMGAPHTVYIANCFPYSYSELLGHLQRLSAGACADNNKHGIKEGNKEKPRRFTIQQLCCTPGRLPVPFITVTALYLSTEQRRYTPEEIRQRPVILLTARVHPGEPNASWMMHGILEALLMPTRFRMGRDPYVNATDTVCLHQAVDGLLHYFVFKIIPMLNPDGVVMGNNRCSIVGCDLNRDYLHPNGELNPVVYSLKQLLRHMITTEQRSVALFTDFHGHSCTRDFLMYGCTGEEVSSLSKKLAVRVAVPTKADSVTPCTVPPAAATVSCANEGCCDEPESFLRKGVSPEMLFPSLLSYCCPSFSFLQCRFKAQWSKRNTGRLVMYMQFGIHMSYTMEASMMGGMGASFKARSSLFSSVLNSDSRCDKLGSAQTEPLRGMQSHYSQDSFITMGQSFLVALHILSMLFAKNNTISKRIDAGDESLVENAVALEDLPQGVRQLAFAALMQLCATGDGGGSQKQILPVDLAAPVMPFSSAIAAGSYSLLTRADRRSRNPTGGSSSIISLSHLNSLPAVLSEGSSPCPITPAYIHQMLEYLFARCHRIEEEDYDDASNGDDENNKGSASDPFSLQMDSLSWFSQPLQDLKDTENGGSFDSAEINLIDEDVMSTSEVSSIYIENDDDGDEGNPNDMYSGELG